MIQTVTSRLRKFVAPVFVYGSGARMLAGQYARNFGVRKVPLVTDPGVVRAGYADEVLQTLTRDVISLMAADARDDPRMVTNPKKPKVEEIEAIYEELL